MKSRKMWAHPEWGTAQNGFHAQPKEPRNRCDFVPVLVTSLEGAPDFEPGDRVRSRGATTGIIATHPQQLADGTWVVVVEWPGNALAVMDADPERLTKLPRETSVLLRVTGPKDGVEAAVTRLERAGFPLDPMDGVRVERVEDPDE